MITNITLSADERDIADMRNCAEEEHTSLNAMFREWMAYRAARYRQSKNKDWERDFDALMDRLSYVEAGRKFTREEMNDRKFMRNQAHDQ